MSKSSSKRKTTLFSKMGKTVPRKYLIWIILAAAGLVLISAFLAGNTSLFKLYQLQQQRNALRTERDQLKAQNEALQTEIKKLETDTDHVEKVAREKYNLKRKDEEVYKIAPEKPER